jgi:hypothetical protein
MTYFPGWPPKTAENAAYWPFQSQEDLERADRSWEESKKRIQARREGYSFEVFQKFLKNGIHRSPELYGARGGKGLEVSKEVNVVRLDAPRIEPQKDFKSEAADHDDWDAKEIAEET